MTISPDDVRRLLASTDADALLVLIEGRTAVIAGAELDSDEYRGALTCASRRQLIDTLGSAEPTEHELAEQAAALDATIGNLGG
ncbi:hypothetical protein ACWDUN_20745 [Mycobacterium sp. NPDC003323]